LLWSALLQLFNVIFQFVLLHQKANHAKELEILLLRRQLAVLQRHNQQIVRPKRGDKFFLAILIKRLKQATGNTTAQLQNIISIVRPETVLRWHSELVRRKWTQTSTSSGGRVPTEPELERLVMQFAHENDWRYGKVVGELRKLGYHVSKQTVGNILKRKGIPPLPKRQPALSWQHLMNHYKDQLLACDFFTMETLFLQTIYVFYFIEIGTRRIHLAGCTAHPTQAWVTQQARQLVWTFDNNDTPTRFLIRDRDTKYSSTFDAIFQSNKIAVIQTPFQAPNANAFAKRWIRSIREECLDKLIIVNQTHLRYVMEQYVDYYNTARPHQGLDQQSPISFIPTSSGCCLTQSVSESKFFDLIVVSQHLKRLMVILKMFDKKIETGYTVHHARCTCTNMKINSL
jgi:putative transposase